MGEYEQMTGTKLLLKIPADSHYNHREQVFDDWVGGQSQAIIR
jgi:hypothetical protein